MWLKSISSVTDDRSIFYTTLPIQYFCLYSYLDNLLSSFGPNYKTKKSIRVPTLYSLQKKSIVKGTVQLRQLYTLKENYTPTRLLYQMHIALPVANRYVRYFCVWYNMQNN